MERKIGVGSLEISELSKQYVNQVLDSNRLSYGDFSRRFESAFAHEHDVRHAILVNSGTDALRIALHAMKIKFGWNDGDEIIVPSVTFVATINVVLQNGMKPVFVDVENRSYNLNPAKLEAAISEKSRAVIPVHLMGLPCDMDPISEICERYSLEVLEDSCECMFATYNGRKVGSLGAMGAFSTYVAHYLVTGVGGFITTNDDELAILSRSLMNHGRDSIYLNIDADSNLDNRQLDKVVKRRFRFNHVGYSSRLTEMEAAIGLAQLEEKDDIIRSRKSIAEKFNQGLEVLKKFLQLPEDSNRNHVFMLYPVVLRNENKWGLVQFLERNQVETRDLFPIIHQPVYDSIFNDIREEFPVADWLHNCGFYIGCHQYMTEQEQDYVISLFHRYFSDH